MYQWYITVTTVILLFLLLTGITEDQLHLAQAIEGERPDLVTEHESLAGQVGHVVLNRLEAGWCDNIKECVDEGFWGAATIVIPQPWALAAAANVLARKESTQAFYVFSLADCHQLGLPLEEALLVARNDQFGLAFYDKDTSWREQCVEHEGQNQAE